MSTKGPITEIKVEKEDMVVHPLLFNKTPAAVAIASNSSSEDEGKIESSSPFRSSKPIPIPRAHESSEEEEQSTIVGSFKSAKISSSFYVGSPSKKNNSRY